MCFWVLLIEISSRKAVPEVTSTFPGPLHIIKKIGDVTVVSYTIHSNPTLSVRTCCVTRAVLFVGAGAREEERE